MADITTTTNIKTVTLQYTGSISFPIYATVNSNSASVKIAQLKKQPIGQTFQTVTILQLSFYELGPGTYPYFIKKTSDNTVIVSGNIIVQGTSLIPTFKTINGNSIIGEGDLSVGGEFTGTLDDIPDGSTYKKVNTEEKSSWNAKQNALGFTPVADNDSRLSDARTPTTHSHNYEPANENIQLHISSTHAPSNAQKNSDITKEEIEAKLTGTITSHTHASSGGLTQQQILRMI